MRCDCRHPERLYGGKFHLAWGRRASHLTAPLDLAANWKSSSCLLQVFLPFVAGVFLGVFFAQLMVWITFLCMWSANALPDFKHISLQVSFRSWESCLRSPNDSSFLFFILSLQTPADPATTLRFWWLFAPVILVSHYIYIKPDLCILMTWDWLKDVASKCSLKKRKG